MDDVDAGTAGSCFTAIRGRELSRDFVPRQRFFSMEELNAAIRPLIIELNERPFQELPGSRRSVFETLDRSAKARGSTFRSRE